MYFIIRLRTFGVSASLAAAMLAACSGGGSSSFGPSGVAPSGDQTGLTMLANIRDAALTMPHFVQPNVNTDHGQSFMRPDKKKGALLYVGDWSTNDVYVYDYPSGKSVGTLTGFDVPDGMCIDQTGDVFITNFGADDAVEYEHGGTSPVNTYSGGGEPIGCAVSAQGDVAITSLLPGEVIVYAGGDPSKGTAYSDLSCEYQWTMGYDAAGDLVGVGAHYVSGSDYVCALLAGSKSETTLTTSGITIHFPGGTTWDGKYIALGDQEAGGNHQVGVWPSTISGTTITAATTTEVTFGDINCDGSEDANPFFVGKTNVTPNSKKQAKSMVGGNLTCDPPAVDVWKYPGGGNPIKAIPLSIQPYGAAVSIAPH
jgi:hypothetical protein